MSYGDTNAIKWLRNGKWYMKKVSLTLQGITIVFIVRMAATKRTPNVFLQKNGNCWEFFGEIAG